jgi:HAMP domain-containing protein
MVEFTRKFFIYFCAALTLLFTFKALPGAPLSWKLAGVAAIFFALVCAVFAWDEVARKGRSVLSKSRHNVEEGSISLSIKQAMADAKYAAREDESIALQANKIVRRGLDKRCIKYKDYKEWRRKNSMIFTAVTDEDNQLIGFFDVFPLTDKAATGLVEGKIHEHELNIESILPKDKNESATKLYIASIMVNPKQTAFSAVIAKDVVVLKLIEFLTSVFPPNEERILFAYAHTGLGENLLKKTTFKNTALPHDNKYHRPLYELSADDYKTIAKDLKDCSEPILTVCT